MEHVFGNEISLEQKTPVTESLLLPLTSTSLVNWTERKILHSAFLRLYLTTGLKSDFSGRLLNVWFKKKKETAVLMRKILNPARLCFVTSLSWDVSLLFIWLCSDCFLFEDSSLHLSDESIFQDLCQSRSSFSNFTKLLSCAGTRLGRVTL